MPAVSSTPDDVTATSSSSAPEIIDLRAESRLQYDIEKYSCTFVKEKLRKKLMEMMLFFLDNNRDILHDGLIPKMVTCQQEDLARPTKKTNIKVQKGINQEKG